MALTYTALITPAELKTAAALTLGNAVNDAIDAETGDLYDAVVEAIEGTTSLIESYLGRELIVRSQTLIFKACDWKTRQGYENSDEDLLYTAWARQWPVVEVFSVDTNLAWSGEITLQEARDDGQFISYDPDSTLVTEPPYQVVAFCGYRRTDHDLAGAGGNINLNTQIGISTLPELLPYAIRRCCVRLCVHDLRQQIQGLVGVATAVTRVDRMDVDIQRTDPDFVRRQLATIHRYRYVPT